MKTLEIALYVMAFLAVVAGIAYFECRSKFTNFVAEQEILTKEKKAQIGYIMPVVKEKKINYEFLKTYTKGVGELINSEGKSAEQRQSEKEIMELYKQMNKF